MKSYSESNGYSYRCRSNFAGGGPGAPARLDGLDERGRPSLHRVTRPGTSLNKVSFCLHWALMLRGEHRQPNDIDHDDQEILCRSSALCHTLASAQTPSPEHWLAIRAGRLFDTKSEKLVTNQVVLIHGDRIAEVGPPGRVKVPAGAEVVDLSHATLLPGLIDAHTHVFGNGPDLEEQFLRDSYQYRTLTALANAQKDLMVGFTTLRDLKTLGASYSDVDLRNAIDRGVVPGPRMQVSTRGLQATGGFIMNGYSEELALPVALQVVDSPWTARQAVREQIAHGTDWIKLYAAYQFHFTADGKMVVPPTFTAEEVNAIVV